VSPQAAQNRRRPEFDRRKAIIDIARPIFLKDGYAATSMATIAAKVGGSKATLYSYFPSKEALFTAVIADTCEDILADVYGEPLEDIDMRTALSRVGARFMLRGLSDECVAVYRLVAAESTRFPELGRTLDESGLAKGIMHLARYLEGRMRLGQLRKSDAHIAAEQFFDLCGAGILHRRLWNVAPAPTEREIAARVERATDTFLRAYGAAG
jgi:AcrR family transcriptional regulator